jgi:hypothetical protein
MFSIAAAVLVDRGLGGQPALSSDIAPAFRPNSPLAV